MRLRNSTTLRPVANSSSRVAIALPPPSYARRNKRNLRYWADQVKVNNYRLEGGSFG